jgi:hypothetical protein
MTEAQAALCQLLERPDPPDLKRGHVVTVEGRSDRWQVYRDLARAFVTLRRFERDGEIYR